ncbi:MAG: tetratricopeptide repeat protein [Flavobacteriales bacterium]|jgi:tetratricopeptide (TPR) repeat protein|nr:MAG: tetratricopeptide repeat protein [Flavobacteriales bacterium]
MRPDPLRTSLTRPFLAIALLTLLGSIHVHGQESRILILRGDSLLKLEKPQRALDFYDEAVRIDPSVNTLLARAKAWYMMDRMDRFLLDVDGALRKDSTSANGHYQRALYALRAQDPVRAEYHSSKAIEYATQPLLKAQAYMVRGMVRSESKRPTSAIEDLERGLAGVPDDTEAMKALARLYDQEGRHADALVQLEKLCVIDPGQVGHWTNRGYELTMLGRYDEALKMIQEALSMDKDEPVALSNRAYVRMLLGQEAEAWSDVERSLRSYPSNAFALRTRAMLRLRKGERARACDDLTLAKALGGIPEVDQLIKENCDTSGTKDRRR